MVGGVRLGDGVAAWGWGEGWGARGEGQALTACRVGEAGKLSSASSDALDVSDGDELCWHRSAEYTCLFLCPCFCCCTCPSCGLSCS